MTASMSNGTTCCSTVNPSLSSTTSHPGPKALLGRPTEPGFEPRIAPTIRSVARCVWPATTTSAPQPFSSSSSCSSELSGSMPGPC